MIDLRTKKQRQRPPEQPIQAGPILVEPGRPSRFGPLGRLRNYFLTGVIVTAPVAITFYVVYQVVTFIDNRFTGLIPDRYNPETYLPFGLPGLGLLVMLVLLTLIGMIAAGFVGRSLVRLGERILSRMPIVRSLYGTLKQIFETVLAQSSRSFREVVLVEYPRRDIWAIGFVTGPTRGEVQDATPDEMVNVFLPTTPNPTSGFLLFVPRQDLIHLDMSIEEGIKMVISGGIVAPPRPWEVKQPVPEPATAPQAAPSPRPAAVESTEAAAPPHGGARPAQAGVA